MRLYESPDNSRNIHSGLQYLTTDLIESYFVYGVDKPEDKLLASCYNRALELAVEKGIKSIAFPALSTGAFSYPMEETPEIAFSTIKGELPGHSDISLIRFVLFSASDLTRHEKVFDRVFR
jgi:O-acetyl-ADP-ribose deacetylase (regulator of RNase III)